MSRFLGDNEEAGPLLLGGAGRAAVAPRASALTAGGGALATIRDRMGPALSAISAAPSRRGEPGRGSPGNGGFYVQER